MRVVDDRGKKIDCLDEGPFGVETVYAGVIGRIVADQYIGIRV
jgi:hypothetical protein